MNNPTIVGLILATLLVFLASCSGSSNTPPIASAININPSSVLVGEVVFLDGSASSDPDGNMLSYTWSFITVPADSETTFTEPFVEKPAFIVDKVGSYVAQLTVNDGSVDSEPDEVSVIVVVPPPTVTIISPEAQSVATANPVTFTGTVDDPLATIEINGTAIVNNSGNFSTDITLTEGSNAVTITASNNSGQDIVSFDIFLKTLPGPKMNILSHTNNFFVTKVSIPFTDPPPKDNIDVTIEGIIKTADGQQPTVTVNGFEAVLFPPGDNPQYVYSADILLSKGQQTITAIGENSAGGKTTIQINGVADYCVRGNNDGGSAEKSDVQNNRCHEIDGCNRDKFGGTRDPLRNFPMPNARFGAKDVQFGEGNLVAEGEPYDPDNDAFVHGLSPKKPLGCNIHDTCYQTCVPPGVLGLARTKAYDDCNVQQFINHSRECLRAYPAFCPFTITVLGKKIKDPVKCPLWRNEKLVCASIALLYHEGVQTVFGRRIYNERQNDYCK